MTTLSKINKYLKQNNIDAELLSGKGYIYFSGPDVLNWKIKIIPGLTNVKDISTDEGKKLFYQQMHLNSF